MAQTKLIPASIACTVEIFEMGNGFSIKNNGIALTKAAPSVLRS